MSLYNVKLEHQTHIPMVSKTLKLKVFGEKKIYSFNSSTSFKTY